MQNTCSRSAFAPYGRRECKLRAGCSRELKCLKAKCTAASSAVPRLQQASFFLTEQALAEKALAQWRTLGRRVVIGIAGVPGSGKSTTSTNICERINEREGRPIAVMVPMDGFHLYREELDQMEDPAHAHLRRGAPFTFNGAAFVDCVRRIRSNEGEVAVPSFDHAVGDPIEGDVRVTPQHEIVLVEGIYVLLDTEPWSQLQALLDDAWFLEVDVEDAMVQVYNRNLGLGLSVEAVRRRIAENDRLNADLVEQSKRHARLIVDMSTAHNRPPRS